MADETWFARFDAGPLEGTKAVSSEVMPFPGPEVIDDPELGGRYVRVSDSQLPPDVHPNVVRGAQYHWEPKEADHG